MRQIAYFEMAPKARKLLQHNQNLRFMNLLCLYKVAIEWYQIESTFMYSYDFGCINVHTPNGQQNK